MTLGSPGFATQSTGGAEPRCAQQGPGRTGASRIGAMASGDTPELPRATSYSTNSTPAASKMGLTCEHPATARNVSERRKAAGGRISTSRRTHFPDQTTMRPSQFRLGLNSCDRERAHQSKKTGYLYSVNS